MSQMKEQEALYIMPSIVRAMMSAGLRIFSMQNPQSGMRDMTLLLSTLMTMTRMDLI
nr:hypothetical protein [Bacteroides acidifaciens]